MKKYFLLQLVLSISIFSFAQESFSIKGKINGTKQENLAGATITQVATGVSTAADANGNFSVNGLKANNNVVLRFSYTGYAAVQKQFDLSKGSVTGVNVVLKLDPLSLTEVVVTGVGSAKSKLNSSVSVSTLKQEDIEKAAPRTTAEIFRSIPGIRSEASGGDGNTNITVRGVPLSAGGSRYLQLQEDGLPVLQFGDIAFATSDIFLRADQTVGKIEAIRGGSASTLATNSPAGIINFISKTGATEGGAVAVTSGVDYNNFRTDFNYGAPIGNGLSFNVGGFYRLGEGPRTAGYTANNGGQLKFNLTKKLNSGFVRFYVKYLNDRSAAYMPMPIQVSGTNSNPTYESLPGFDALHGAIHSPYLMQNLGLGVSGELRRSDVSDGMHPVSHTAGVEFNFDLGEGWRLEDRAKYATNSGRFIAPFTASVGATDDILATVAGATSWNLTGATVKNSVTGAAYTGTNAMIIHMFDTELSNFNNFMNDLKVKKKFGATELTFGYYKSFQNIGMSWLWNSYLTDVNGNGTAPLNIYDNTGKALTQNGLFAYGVPVWGNCCQRNYDLKYEISAPYVAASFDVSKDLTVDASARWDIGKVTGSYAGSAQTQFDVNNDGVISANEKSVSGVNLATAAPVNYKYDYVSYSIGANYKLDDNKAIFGRYSSGGAAQADRLMFSPNVLADGSAKGTVNKLEQAELGFKQNFNKGGIFVTAFYAKVNEAGGYEATTQKVIENHYKSFGVEIETNLKISDALDLRGSLTYTDAKITDGANKDNRPRRQSPIIYNFVPTYNARKLSAGISFIGTGSSYAQDENKLKFKGYVIVNPFINYRFTPKLVASINGNNVANTLGITEAEEGSITENKANIIRARSITGRTISATLAFNF